MAAGFETAVDTRGDSTILKDSMGAMISKVLAAKVMADKERAYAKKEAWKQGIDEAQFDAMNPPGFFFRKALIGEFGGFAIKKKKQELAALYRKGLLLGKISKNKQLRGKVIGQLKQSLIYSKANLKNAKKFRSQFDYNDYDEMFAPQSEKVPSTRKKVQNAIGGGTGKRVSREQIIVSIDAIAKSIEKTAQSITQSSASVYGTLITANQLQADVAQDLKVRNTTLEDKLQKLVDVISNQTQVQKDFIDKKEDIQQESKLEGKRAAAGAETPDDLRTIVNESRSFSTFANEQAMMDPYLRQPPEVKPVNSMVNDTASMEAYGYPKAERGGMFGKGGVELHGTEALASDRGIKIVSGPDSGYLHEIDEPSKVIPIDNNATQGEKSAVTGKVEPKPKTPAFKLPQFEMGTKNSYAPAALNINTDASQPVADAMDLAMMAAGGGILASTTNYINSLGASADEIKPELSKVTRSVAKVYGLPSTIAAKASGSKSIKKLDDKKKNKKEEDTGGKKNLFEKMKEGFGKFMELLGKKINDADPSDPNGTGGPGAVDYSNLKSGDISTMAGKAATLYDEFRNIGYTDEGSKRLVAEIGREGGMQNKNLFGTHTDPAAGISNTGMISWNDSRREKLIAAAKKAGVWDEKKGQFFETAEALRFQARFMANEIPTYKGALDKALRTEGSDASKISAMLRDDYIVYRADAQYSGGKDAEYGSGKSKEWYQRLTPGLEKTYKPGGGAARPTSPVAGNPPGALATGQRPDLALSDPQYKAQQKAIKEADAMGLTGKERAKYIADKVMAVPSPIFQRPSQQSQASTITEISTNPRQNAKPQIVALNSGGNNNTQTAGAATPPSLSDSTIPSGRNPLKDSGLYIG